MENTNSWNTNYSHLYVVIGLMRIPLHSVLLVLSLSLLVHDESTFRSGEVSAKRWLYNDQAPFYSKGRGRSNMLSDFLVMHQSGPFFQLSPGEYDKALKKYPDLADQQDIEYIERSASVSMHVGSDNYFDNSTILAQFERLFKLLEFKECFKNHRIEIVVNNARTHSARTYNVLDFGKGISTRCPMILILICFASIDIVFSLIIYLNDINLCNYRHFNRSINSDGFISAKCI